MPDINTAEQYDLFAYGTPGDQARAMAGAYAYGRPYGVDEPGDEPETATGLPFLNPKDAEAARVGKRPLDLLEPAADSAIAAVMAYGADTYGRQNYRVTPIWLRAYIAAIKRHCDDILDGEDIASDSGLSHWAHIGANVHVVLGALQAGTLIDDRGPEERT